MNQAYDFIVKLKCLANLFSSNFNIYVAETATAIKVIIKPCFLCHYCIWNQMTLSITNEVGFSDCTHHPSKFHVGNEFIEIRLMCIIEL